MDNPETKFILDILDTGQIHVREKAEAVIKNGQSRDNVNIGHTRQRRNKR